ncbi:multiple inositol polyphosphate phosphatase 1 [Agrilus planipennis]|uniref:Multiple inositol polyphosphate phosphatase 1 n=1 Tax=Agrilus planipennis TaxID=224129 RepID=A0A1W4WIW2_AGRPL|nr:multiple inositol polyphosphate phosphatase 1 [Agrilus planipennis]
MYFWQYRRCKERCSLYLLQIFVYYSLIVLIKTDNCNIFPEYNLYLGTKTPYRLIANLSDHKIEVKGCTPLKIWYLIRHGTRNPGAGFINKANQRLSHIRDQIIQNKHLLNKTTKCINGFDKWHMDVKELEAKNLRLEGEDEMVLLAERMQKRFPEILSHIYSNTSYFFKYTKTQRTKASASCFTKGLFGKFVSRDIWYPESLEKDPVLRFYKLCTKWQTTIKKRPETLKERELLKQKYGKQIIESLNKTLGFGLLTTMEDVHLIYTMCSFETAWQKRKESVWCSLLDKETFKVLEYYEDLKYYWIDGYGNSLNHNQACVAFQDLINFFENEDPYPKAKIYFTHSGTLLKMIAHFGLYKDVLPLTHKNFQKISNRQWKVSKIDAFGTNLALVLYRCEDQLKVLTLHQERIVYPLGCPREHLLCNLNDFKKNFKHSINCQFDKMCSL